MALIPLKEFCEDNPYGFTAQKIRYLLKQDPSSESFLRRISTRTIFVDEEELEAWLRDKSYYHVSRKKKAI